MIKHPPRRSRIRMGSFGIALLLSGPFLMGACSSDESAGEQVDNAGSALGDAVDNAGSAVGDAVDNAGSAVENAGSAISGTDDNADEGTAKDYAVQMVDALAAMTGGGEPTVANLQEAAKLVPAPGAVSGIEDTDGDGIDDDAKATVETDGGNDKACVQSQDAAWEATDDEC